MSTLARTAAALAEVDPEIAAVIHREERRQRDTLEMIPSENYASAAVIEAVGSVLTNKYAEGYPGARYYHGNEFIDQAETLAIERAKALFGVEHANVQPHSGAQGEPLRLSGAYQARRHRDGDEARRWRAPDARPQRERERQAL